MRPPRTTRAVAPAILKIRLFVRSAQSARERLRAPKAQGACGGDPLGAGVEGAAGDAGAGGVAGTGGVAVAAGVVRASNHATTAVMIAGASGSWRRSWACLSQSLRVLSLDLAR